MESVSWELVQKYMFMERSIVRHLEKFKKSHNKQHFYAGYLFIAVVLTGVALHFIFLPVFQELQLTSTYEVNLTVIFRFLLVFIVCFST